MDARKAKDLDARPGDPSVGPLQQVLDALVDPVRRSIVGQLYHAGGRDIRCGDFEMNISKSTGTHHFRVLREAGLIHQYPEGTAKLNTLRREQLERAYPGLLRAFYGES